MEKSNLSRSYVACMHMYLLCVPSLEELVEEANLSRSYVAHIFIVLLHLRSWWRSQTCPGVALRASPSCSFTYEHGGGVKLVPELRSVHLHCTPSLEELVEEPNLSWSYVGCMPM